jgi:hypothetical protein
MLTQVKRLDRCGTIRNQTSHCTWPGIWRCQWKRPSDHPNRCHDPTKLARCDQYKQRTTMAASSKLMITEAERRFPCRIKVGVPIGGLGARLTEMQVWLDENCGSDGWIRHRLAYAASSTMRSRSISSTPPWLRLSSPAGAPDQRSRSATGHSKCARISPRTASRPGRIRRRFNTRRVRQPGERFIGLIPRLPTSRAVEMGERQGAEVSISDWRARACFLAVWQPARRYGRERNRAPAIYLTFATR